MNRPTHISLAAAAAVAAFAFASPAQDRKVGDWSVGLMKERLGAYAATVNDGGALLGQFCYREEGRCVWILANDIACRVGNEYQILLNSDSGAASLEIVCVEIDGTPRFAFSDFDTIDAIVRRARWMGLAFPMEDGHFHVARFSLSGATRAVAAMRQVAEAMAARPASRRGEVAGFRF